MRRDGGEVRLGEVKLGEVRWGGVKWGGVKRWWVEVRGGTSILWLLDSVAPPPSTDSTSRWRGGRGAACRLIFHSSSTICVFWEPVARPLASSTGALGALWAPTSALSMARPPTTPPAELCKEGRKIQHDSRTGAPQSNRPTTVLHSLRTTGLPQGPPGATRGHQGPPGASMRPARATGAIRGHWEPQGPPAAALALAGLLAPAQGGLELLVLHGDLRQFLAWAQTWSVCHTTCRNT